MRDKIYKTSLMADAEVHNGGSFFVSYYKKEVEIERSSIYLYKRELVKGVEQDRELLLSGEFTEVAPTNKDVFMASLVSNYNAKYIVPVVFSIRDGVLILHRCNEVSTELYHVLTHGS